MDKNLVNRTQAVDFRFPPTRAARATRSRGVFLAEASDGANGARASWIEVPVAIVAVAAAAFALAVCFKASSIVGPAVGINPGPAIVAAASVAPPFVATPVTLR